MNLLKTAYDYCHSAEVKGALTLIAAGFLLSTDVFGVEVSPLPPGNLVVNPWFRDFDNPIHAGYNGWTVDQYWNLSQKAANPTPDEIHSEKCGEEYPWCGTTARLKDTKGQETDNVGVVGVPAMLYQVVAADPEVTRFSFGVWWVALRMDAAEIRILGGESVSGPWQLLWTPFSYSYTGGTGRSNFEYHHTGYMEEDFEEGYSYFRIELYGVLADDQNGVKFTGVYFAPAALDGDSDGIGDQAEDGAPNNGDGNLDGISDREQENVTSLFVPSAGEYLTLESPAGTRLADVQVANSFPSNPPPSGLSFTVGLFEFTVKGISPGQAVDIKVLLPPSHDASSYYRYGPTPDNQISHWYEYLFDGDTGAELADDHLILHFVDGQLGDDDLLANGEVVDSGGPVQVLTTFYFPQVADGGEGPLKFQSTMILVNTGSDTIVRIEFYGSPNGAPMEISLGELGINWVFEFELKKGASISLATPGTGNLLKVGYARVLAGDNVGGVIVFQHSDLRTGITLFEAGVPASRELTSFSLFVDSLGVRDSGVAIVYPPQQEEQSRQQSADASVTFRLYDREFNLIAERTLDPLPPGTHLARFVYQIFDDPTVRAQAQEMEGILTVESDRPLIAVTLRQNDDPHKEFPQEVPTLTTFPVIPGRPD